MSNLSSPSKNQKWEKNDSTINGEVNIFDQDKATNGPDEVPVVQMEKTIGLLTSVTIIIGSMIGSGIFASPTGIMKSVNSLGLSLIIWVASGIYSLLGAYCYAELGTMINKSGGDYSYFYEAYGGFSAFLRLWIEVLVVRPASAAAIALVFGLYILIPFYPSCKPPDLQLRLIAFLCILIITFINCYSVRLSNRVQDIFTYAKLLALLIIIGTGIYNMSVGKTTEFNDLFYESNYSFGSLVTGFYAGLFAYSGWNYLNCMIDEMRNPRRDLPIAIIFSCLVVTAIYTFTVASYATVLSLTETIETSAVATVFAQRMYGVMWVIMPIFVSFSCFGGINGTLLTTSRIFLVAAQYKHMPVFASMIHRTKLTPIPAVLFTSVTSMVYLFFPDVFALMNYLGFVQWTAIALAVLIVLIFRIRFPNLPRPVKVPIVFPIIYLLFSAFLTIFSFQGSPVESLIGCLFVLSGIPAYLIGVSWKKPKSLEHWILSITVWGQKVFEVIPTNN